MSPRPDWSTEAPLMLPLAYSGRRRGETLTILQESFGRLNPLSLAYEDDLEPAGGAATRIHMRRRRDHCSGRLASFVGESQSHQQARQRSGRRRESPPHYTTLTKLPER